MADAPHATWSLATPQEAGGAIAVVHLRGEIDEAFASLSIKPVPVGGVALRILAGIDRGIIARFDATHALLMPHAGPAVVRAVIDALRAAGIAEEHAPLARDLFPEARSEVEAKALLTLAHAPSRLAVAMLLVQHDRWQVPGATSNPARDAVLSRLLHPPLVVAVGASNIGKSSLLNALAQRTVAIVADEPGTTRDHVGVQLDLAGLVVRWVDTPGIRDTDDAEELRARELALDLARHADLLILCGDAKHPPITLANVPARDAFRLALRIDLGHPAWPHDAGVSATTGVGLEALVTTLRERLMPASALSDPRPWRFWDESPPLP